MKLINFSILYKPFAIFEEVVVQQAQHLGPELGHFKKFEFSDYEIDAEVDLPYAFTTETYIYTIVLNPDEKAKVER